MKKLTYADIVAAARKAYDENRLQAQQDVRWRGCHYRVGGGVDIRVADANDWGSDKPVVVCAVGAALDDEQFAFLASKNALGGSVRTSSDAWREIFATTLDSRRAAKLQELHDYWATTTLGDKPEAAERFLTMLNEGD